MLQYRTFLVNFFKENCQSGPWNSVSCDYFIAQLHVGLTHKLLITRSISQKVAYVTDQHECGKGEMHVLVLISLALLWHLQQITFGDINLKKTFSFQPRYEIARKKLDHGFSTNHRCLWRRRTIGQHCCRAPCANLRSESDFVQESDDSEAESQYFLLLREARKSVGIVRLSAGSWRRLCYNEHRLQRWGWLQWRSALGRTNCWKLPQCKSQARCLAHSP